MPEPSESVGECRLEKDGEGERRDGRRLMTSSFVLSRSAAT